MLRLSFKTTTLCRTMCNDCSVQKWMEYYPNWHCSLDDVERFIYYTKKSGYQYDHIYLTGGEPLLWKNLKEAVILLADLTPLLVMCTSAVNYSGDIAETIDRLDKVSVSLYKGNEEKAHLLKEDFPDKVKIADQQLRYISPTEPIENSLPANCICTGYGFDHGMIDICPPARTLIIRMGWNLEDFDFTTELCINYLDKLSHIKRESQELCKCCIGNTNIYDQLEQTEVRCN